MKGGREIESVYDYAEQLSELKRKKTDDWRKGANGFADRLPPHSPESEVGVLGCVMVSPNEIIPLAIEKFGNIGSEVFYDLRHQLIYSEMISMYDERIEIDNITIFQRLKDRNLVDQVGGVAYLMGLSNEISSVANFSCYAEIAIEKYRLRKLIQTCSEVIGRVYDYEGDVESLMGEIERHFLQMAQTQTASTIVPMKELIQGAIFEIEDSYEKKLGLSGIGTGFIDLDKMIDGMHAGEMLVLAARPSMGKTSLAMNITEFVATEQKLPVGVFSLEMTAKELAKRMLCSRSRVNLRNVRDGFLAERDFTRMTIAAGNLSKAGIHIDDTAGMNIIQLRAKARRMVQRFGIKLFVVDYLQLMQGAQNNARRSSTREQEVADIANGIKTIAKELNVPFLLLSQLNRELDKDRNRKPRLSDLRESGAIEQAADGVWMLYVPNRNENDDNEDATPINLLIAKQRNGPTGDVHLTFFRSYTRFESAAKVMDEEFTEYKPLPPSDR